MRIFFFLVTLILVTAAFGADFSLVRAEQPDVQMSVTVVERKITDTINDFDFSGLNSKNDQGIASKKQVKGVSTSKSNFWPKAYSVIKYPFEQIRLFFRVVF